MANTFRDARNSVASALGADISYFTPPEERRFEPATVALALAALLICDFLRAAAKKAGERVGSKVVDALAGDVSRSVEKAGAGDRASDAEADARKAWTEMKTQGLGQAALTAVGDEVQAVMVEALKKQHLPPEKASHLAQVIRTAVFSLPES